jgi:hypothetical protein
MTDKAPPERRKSSGEHPAVRELHRNLEALKKDTKKVDELSERIDVLKRRVTSSSNPPDPRREPEDEEATPSEEVVVVPESVRTPKKSP